MTKIELIQEDITKMKVDAIVNAANSTLHGGGGVDGDIHRTAGPGLLVECKTLGGCPVGEAKVTSGYNLLAKFIIHTVGPIWHDGKNNEEPLLANCYLNCLLIAEHLKLKTIAFPNISTGAYRFPKRRAAEIAIKTVNDYIKKTEYIETIYFVVFDEENLKIYQELLHHK